MDKVDVKNIIDKIAEDLLNNNQFIKKTDGIYGGGIGVAIFFALYYLQGNKQEQTYLDQVYKIVEQSLNQISSQDSNSLLGVAGIGWGIQYLVNIGIIKPSEATPYTSKLTSFIRQSLKEDKDSNNYDLMYGYIGKAIFLMQTNKQNEQVLQELLDDCLSFFESFVVTNDEGIAWVCSDFIEKNTFYLGLSHGVASIIHFLSGLYTLINSKQKKEQVKHLIIESCRWLLNKEKDKRGQELSFPSIYPEPQTKPVTSLAWCHGDLGISLALIKAGKVLNNLSILNEGLRIAQKGSRLILNNSGIKHKEDIFDCSLCHGVYGAFLIYYLLYVEFNVLAFKKASDYWLSIILEQNTNSFHNLFCGIKNVNKDPANKEILIETQATGLLLGVTGSALALLTYTANISDNHLNKIIKRYPWYEILMLNL